MPDDFVNLLDTETMDSARAGHPCFKTRFDPNCIRREGFLVEGSNAIRSTEYHVRERFRGRQLQALSNLYQEWEVGNGGDGPTYFDWPLPPSASEAMSQDNINNLGAWPGMEAGLSSGAHAEMDPNVLLSNLSVLQQKAQQLEAFVQEGRHDQPASASGFISSILYELIVTAASVLFSVQNRESANPASAYVQPGPDPGACVEIQAENRAPPLGLGFGKLPSPNGASVVGFAGRIGLPDMKSSSDIKAEGEEEAASPGNRFYKIIEIDEGDILVEHAHFCEICGKGFRRDANVRMHMRAHGDEYKTHQALMSKPTVASSSCSPRARRYSCPFERCKRNKNHRKFKPLKSITCLKNHYKRSHCPKIYTCQKCNKQFSVVGDLKTHGKHCGHNPWHCSCGTTFTRKDKLFSHVALFHGHKPLLPDHDLVLPPAPKRHKVTSNGRAATGHATRYGNDANLTEFLSGDLAGPADNKFQVDGDWDRDDDNLLSEPNVIERGHGQNEVTIETPLTDSVFWADFSRAVSRFL